MNDSTVTSAQGAPGEARWLLLIHQIPPKPDYFRVKVGRRLRRMGAVALKNSVYVLPRGDEALEDFQWLAREIEADGGEATVCEAAFVAGITNQELAAMFRSTPVREETPLAAGKRQTVKPGRTWVTRQGVKVDRIASAWLIRRFLDPRARFKFVPAKGYQPAAGELRFDMFEAEYTHEGDRCTFETLLARFGVRDRALRAIADIVHDVDCKDEKFQRDEAAGLAALVSGIAAAHAVDAERLARGASVFDDLYAGFRKPHR
jgi:hypothetical protein